jgi:hypothetical protein
MPLMAGAMPLTMSRWSLTVPATSPQTIPGMRKNTKIMATIDCISGADEWVNCPVVGERPAVGVSCAYSTANWTPLSNHGQRLPLELEVRVSIFSPLLAAPRKWHS